MVERKEAQGRGDDHAGSSGRTPSPSVPSRVGFRVSPPDTSQGHRPAGMHVRGASRQQNPSGSHVGHVRSGSEGQTCLLRAVSLDCRLEHTDRPALDTCPQMDLADHSEQNRVCFLCRRESRDRESEGAVFSEALCCRVHL